MGEKKRKGYIGRAEPAFDEVIASSRATKKIPDAKRSKDVHSPPEIPKSIDAIIRYMDELEPTKHYFERQKDSRNGCSKTRKKLRKFADENPEHPAVVHYKESNKWQPPTESVLRQIIALLKKIINGDSADYEADNEFASKISASVAKEKISDATRSEDDQPSAEIPKSIDAILRYMDELEPTKKYFERQKDSRNGCSKTRKKLRKFADENPGHPAVVHYKETNKWQPPNECALHEIIGLLKQIIN